MNYKHIINHLNYYYDKKLEKLFDTEKSIVKSEMNSVIGGAVGTNPQQTPTMDPINCQDTKISGDGRVTIIYWEAEQNGYA